MVDLPRVIGVVLHQRGDQPTRLAHLSPVGLPRRIEICVGERRDVTPERLVELHFLRCELLGAPAPQLGQEMRWVARDELGALRFPPADAELIRLLCEQD